jgi:hypothetical protein
VKVSLQSCQQQNPLIQIAQPGCKKMISHQSLSLEDAMKLADFSTVDINNKNMQQKVL